MEEETRWRGSRARVGRGRWGQVGGGRGGGRLRYQVLLRLLALEEFGLGARHVDVCGVGAVVQEVVEGVEVVRLWDGAWSRKTRGKKDF